VGFWVEPIYGMEGGRVRGIEASNGVGREVSFLFILFDLIIIAFIFSMAWCLFFCFFYVSLYILCLCALAGLFLFETHYIFNQMTIVLILYNVLLFCALTYLSLFVLSPWYAVVADYVFMSVCFGWSIFI